MNSKFKQLVDRANLNYRKEIIILILINLILIAGMVLVYVYTKLSIFFIPFIFLIFLVDGVCAYRYVRSFNKHTDELMWEVSNLFRYLYLDINNKVSVMEALEDLKTKASLKMTDYITALLNEMDYDVSLSPFLKFANNFPSVLVEEMMINLYQYKRKRTLAYLRNFNQAYFKLKNLVDEDDKNNNQKQFDFAKITAIIGAAIIVILVIVSTIIIVGQYIHG